MNTYFKSKIGLLKSKYMYKWSFFHSRRLTKFYGKLLVNCNLCFDIGAHLGDRSKCFLELNKKVVAVEPQPLFAAKLRERFSKNKHFMLEEIGLGAENTKGQLQISSLHPTVSTIANAKWRKSLNAKANNKIKWDQKVDINILTLDSLIEKYGKPDFCKIDVEGFELEVLEGLTSQVKLVSFEFFSFTLDRTIKCLDALEALGIYEYNISLEDSLVMEFGDRVRKLELLNYLEPLTGKTITGDIYAFAIPLDKTKP